MDGFIRTTKPALSGPEKVAILLAEIGPFFNSNYDELFEKLHLSTKEIKKIRKAMQKLGRFAPAYASSYEKGMEQINRESSVLQEALDYGARRGILSKQTKIQAFQKSVKQMMPDKIKDMANQNPDDVAKVIRSWLGE